MSNNFNKKKFIFIPSFKSIKYLIIILTVILFLFLIYEELYFKKRYKVFLQEFSVKYNYLLETYETNVIRRAEKLEISNIINAHLGKSIFLIPLSSISYIFALIAGRFIFDEFISIYNIIGVFIIIIGVAVISMRH